MEMNRRSSPAVAVTLFAVTVRGLTEPVLSRLLALMTGAFVACRPVSGIAVIAHSIDAESAVSV
jgi:hypothetical protein